MVGSHTRSPVSGTVKIVAAALVGAAGGLVVTAVALGSPAFGIFGAIGGAVATAIAAAIHVERSEA
jgi:hypothetical protein